MLPPWAVTAQILVLQAVAAPPQREPPQTDSPVGSTAKYCESTWQTRRRPTRTVEVSCCDEALSCDDRRSWSHPLRRYDTWCRSHAAC